jgi:hypothetical protein
MMVSLSALSVPLQALSDPESFMKLTFPDLMTTAEEGDTFVSPRSPVKNVEWHRGFQEIKVPRFHDNGTGWC